jgi:hypothetical protein
MGKKQEYNMKMDRREIVPVSVISCAEPLSPTVLKDEEDQYAEDVSL